MFPLFTIYRVKFRVPWVYCMFVWAVIMGSVGSKKNEMLSKWGYWGGVSMGHSGGFSKRVVRYVRAPQQAHTKHEWERTREDWPGWKVAPRKVCVLPFLCPVFCVRDIMNNVLRQGFRGAELYNYCVTCQLVVVVVCSWDDYCYGFTETVQICSLLCERGQLGWCCSTEASPISSFCNC